MLRGTGEFWLPLSSKAFSIHHASDKWVTVFSRMTDIIQKQNNLLTCSILKKKIFLKGKKGLVCKSEVDHDWSDTLTGKN